MHLLADDIDATDPGPTWVRLQQKPVAERRVALILDNDGDGVGSGALSSTLRAILTLKDEGYRVEDMPTDGAALRQALRQTESDSIQLNDYMGFFNALPAALRDSVTARWGSPEADPYFIPGTLDCGRFPISVLRAGNIVIASEPAQGASLDPARPPAHNYLAFHAWLRDQFRADVIVPMGGQASLDGLLAARPALSPR